jgi:hypothetical protein
VPEEVGLLGQVPGGAVQARQDQKRQDRDDETGMNEHRPRSRAIVRGRPRKAAVTPREASLLDRVLHNGTSHVWAMESAHPFHASAPTCTRPGQSEHEGTRSLPSRPRVALR